MAKSTPVNNGFIVEHIEGKGSVEIKRQLWTDIVRRTTAPKLLATNTLPSGNILLKPGNQETLDAIT